MKNNNFRIINGLDFFCRFTINDHLAIWTHPAIGVIMTRVRANYKLNVIPTPINKNKTLHRKNHQFIYQHHLSVRAYPSGNFRRTLKTKRKHRKYIVENTHNLIALTKCLKHNLYYPLTSNKKGSLLGEPCYFDISIITVIL